MSALSKAGGIALKIILAALDHLSLPERARVLDQAKEEAVYDAYGNAKLAARKKTLKK